MGRKYKKPPVVEALCEFQFMPGQPWDLTIPGLIYEKTKNDFPDKQQQVGIGFQFRPTERGVEQKAEPAPPRMQFHRKDKTALIQVAPDLLAVNQLVPYPNWEKFKPVILKNLEIYLSIAKPKGFKRIGLRYINKVKIDSESVELNEYFNFYPHVPVELPQFHNSFISRVEIPYDGNDRMLITIANASPEGDNVSIVLDLDYITTDIESISLENTKKWIEEAHIFIEKAFEGCITDKSREIFEEIK